MYHIAGSNAVGSTLNITQINREHMGTYVCEANNGIPPSALQEFDVQVYCKLVIISISIPIILLYTCRTKSLWICVFLFALSIYFQCFPMQCLFSSAGKQFPGKHSAPNIFISSLYHCVRYHHSDYNQRLLSNEVIFNGVKNNLEHWNGETEQHPEVDELRIMDLRVIDY